jgi:hypothetical protein
MRPALVIDDSPRDAAHSNASVSPAPSAFNYSVNSAAL